MRVGQALIRRPSRKALSAPTAILTLSTGSMHCKIETMPPWARLGQWGQRCLNAKTPCQGAGNMGQQLLGMVSDPGKPAYQDPVPNPTLKNPSLAASMQGWKYVSRQQLHTPCNSGSGK